MTTSPLIGKFDTSGNLIGICADVPGAAPHGPTTILRDANGNPAGLIDPFTGKPSGIGSSTDQSTGAPVVDPQSLLVLKNSKIQPSPISQGLIAHFSGDSLTANGFLNSDESTTAQNLIMVADMWLGGVLGHIVNGGVSGQRSDAALALLPGQLVGTTYDVAFIGPLSVNDIDIAKGPMLTGAQTIANYEGMLALYFSQPTIRRVYLMKVHRPQSSFAGSINANGDAGRAWYRAVTDWMDAKAISDPRVIVIPWGDAVTNAAGTAMRTNYNQDTTHVNYLATDGGKTPVKAALSLLPFIPFNMPSTQTDYSNLLGPSSILTGAFAAGAGGVTTNTGFTTGFVSCPGGLLARRPPGDATSTGSNITSVASPVGLDSVSAQMDYAIGADGIFVGFTVGSTLNGDYTTARATGNNSTAYTWGRVLGIAGNTLLGLQIFTPGTTGTSVPDFSSVQEGSFVQDGTAVWLVTRIPQFGDKILFNVDLSIVSCTPGANGGVSPVVWINFIDNLGNQTSNRYINYAGINTGGVKWPTTTGRCLLRRRMTVPTTAGTYIKRIEVFCGVQGANGSSGQWQLHRVTAQKVG